MRVKFQLKSNPEEGDDAVVSVSPIPASSAYTPASEEEVAEFLDSGGEVGLQARLVEDAAERGAAKHVPAAAENQLTSEQAAKLLAMSVDWF